VKAVVFAGEGRAEVDEAPEPRIQDGADAIVRVSLTAICGSDLHLLHGKTPGMRVGGVIGHEFVGEVVEAGPEATAHPAGTRVLGSFLIACGVCSHCRKGRFNHCVRRRALGLGTLTGDLDGAQAELVRVPIADLNLHALDRGPDALSDEAALFCGDVFATGIYTAHLAAPEPGDLTAVIGAGPIGLLIALAVKDKGGRALLLDNDPTRIAFSRGVGVDAALVGDEDAAQVVRAANDGEPADIAVDAVGSIPVFKTAMKCVRAGGRVVVVGVYGAERAELSMGRAWINGIDIRFSGMANVQAHWDHALEAVRSGSVDPTKVITHRLPLEDAVRGYEMFEARDAMKVVLTP
jgi:threonine dehydrogenase-like Zn-dependent dehydrogenase